MEKYDLWYSVSSNKQSKGLRLLGAFQLLHLRSFQLLIIDRYFHIIFLLRNDRLIVVAALRTHLCRLALRFARARRAARHRTGLTEQQLLVMRVRIHHFHGENRDAVERPQRQIDFVLVHVDVFERSVLRRANPNDGVEERPRATRQHLLDREVLALRVVDRRDQLQTRLLVHRQLQSIDFGVATSSASRIASRQMS